MRHRLSLLAGIFVAGIIFAAYARMPLWCAFSALSFCCVLAVFADRRTWYAAVLFFLVFSAGAVALRTHDYLGPGHINAYRSVSAGEYYRFTGFVVKEPVTQNGVTTFTARLSGLQSSDMKKSCRGDILVRCRFPVDYEYGQEVSFFGKLRFPFSAPGRRGTGYRRYLRNQGIKYICAVESATLMYPTGRFSGSSFVRWSLRLKKKFSKTLSGLASPVTAGILSAMLWGEKEKVPAVVYESMVQAGTVHILVVSGYNVGIVAGLIFGIMKFCRIPRAARYMCAPLFLIGYCLMTGACPPVVRATIMAGILVFARWIQRDADALDVCAASAMAILIAAPRQIFDISFQLSFGAVVGILLLYPALQSVCGPFINRFRAVRWLANSVFVAFSAWAGTAGFIFYYFSVFSPVSIVANIFIPAIAGVITISGLSLVLIGAVSPLSATSFVPANEYLVSLLIKCNAFFCGFV